MQGMKFFILNLLLLNPFQKSPARLFILDFIFDSPLPFFMLTHSPSLYYSFLLLFDQKLCGYREKISFRLLGDLLITAEYLNKVFYAFSRIFLFSNFLSASLHHLSRSTFAKCHDNILLFSLAWLFFAFRYRLMILCFISLPSSSSCLFFKD